ncbi:Wzz/FepE/Etk N-terminal domain-containing protein [Gammaproteobacteria bacterium]|nr:Wzz/FepE/Etk N-terminal domain-containing protein [Gammaproteobacteria bacterium]
MREQHNGENPNNFDDVIDLPEVLNVLLNGKWIIFSMTAFISIVGVIYSLSLPNIYESKALLAPVKSSNNVSGNLSSYSNLVGLAGINLNSGNKGNSSKAVKKISSLSFFENNILKNIHLPDLMALKSWNAETNTLVYDKKLYDESTNTWIRDSSHQRPIPSAQESFKAFQAKLSLNVDKKSGFATFSIKHQSPFIAKQWAELVVNEVNGFYRLKDKSESEKAARYLNEQISMTSLSEIKQVLAQLLQEEIKKLTLIEATQYYVFDFIDPPAVMETKIEPIRSLICILFSLIGGILSILFVLVRHYAFNKEVS